MDESRRRIAVIGVKREQAASGEVSVAFDATGNKWLPSTAAAPSDSLASVSPSAEFFCFNSLRASVGTKTDDSSRRCEAKYQIFSVPFQFMKFYRGVCSGGGKEILHVDSDVSNRLDVKRCVRNERTMPAT